MRVHDKLHTYIYEEKVGVYMFRKRFATWCVCVYVCLAACLSKQLGIASRRTGLLLCELCVKLAPYRSFGRSIELAMHSHSWRLCTRKRHTAKAKGEKRKHA